MPSLTGDSDEDRIMIRKRMTFFATIAAAGGLFVFGCASSDAVRSGPSASSTTMPIPTAAALAGPNRCTMRGDYSYCGSSINKYTPCCRKHDDCEDACGNDKGCHDSNHGKCDACFDCVDRCGDNGDCRERCSYDDKYRCK